MSNALTHAIQKYVLAFLWGERTRSDSQDWLLGAIWNLEERGDPTAVDLTYEIKLAFAEQSRGHISAAQFRERLSALAQTTASVA